MKTHTPGERCSPLRRGRAVGLSRAAVLLALLLASCAPQSYFIPPNSGQRPAAPVSLDETPAPAVTGQVEASLPQQQETQAAENEAPSGPAANASPPASPVAVDNSPILYYSQAADTLPVLAVRFGVEPDEVFSPDLDPLPAEGLLSPGLRLFIPRRLGETTRSEKVLPDSELVYSPSAADFDIEQFVNQAGGALSNYQTWLQSTGMNSGAQLVRRVALENSINPRLLLALLEYQGGWVYGSPPSATLEEYPLGYVQGSEKGLYRQLVWAVNHLSVGYYGYREGRLTEITFSDGDSARLAPDLNAGTVALQYFFAQIFPRERWQEAMDPEQGFPALYRRMFGDPWVRAQTVEPLYPIDLVQPPLTLPFEPGHVWAFTGGPHGAWEHDGSYAALDFAPPSIGQGCLKSDVWVTAVSSGLVVRSEAGVVVLDLDGDGSELTGWVLVYLHVSHQGRIPVGTFVVQGQPLGHPSCEGGFATGTHVHIARKYNGEWIAAGGPTPFNLSGWEAHAGEKAYLGTLTNDGQTVTACTCSNNKSFISLGDTDP